MLACLSLVCIARSAKIVPRMRGISDFLLCCAVLVHPF
jgi:hypothetical protein